MTGKKIKTVLDFQGLIKAFVKPDTAVLGITANLKSSCYH